jgi:LytR cell envelope-related transcriptional attenuator
MRPPERSPAPSRPIRASDQRARDQRGVVFPSPVVVLSVVAVAMAAFAFVATRGQEPTEREVTRVASTPSPTATPTSSAPSMPTAKPKPSKPAIVKGEVYVEVYNNSGISGLAGRVAATATQAGWKVVGSDNWYGTIPASTVYYPPKLQRAARALALDLGIRRTVPAIDPMKLDRLTVILTSDHA